MSKPTNASDSARTQKPDRHQVRLLPRCLNDALPADHRARAVWDFVTRLDLSAFYEPIRAVEGAPGRPPIDPAILVSLWVYATVEGVGSARELDRMCEEHDAYRWICGGVGVNYHTLADFRVKHGAAMDKLLAQTVGLLMQQGLVELRRVTQDGVRVRASAGSNSYRGPMGLHGCLEDARHQVENLRREIESDPAGMSRRETAARERAVRERQERIETAIRMQKELAEEQAEKAKKNHERRPRPGEGPRVSATDPDASVMRMSDGGSRPAYNVQLATDTKNGVVVGVDVSTVGNDAGLMEPMARQLESHHGARPKEWVADKGYMSKADIEAMEARGHRVYVPVPDRKISDRDEDSGAVLPGVRRWRRRMRTARAKAISGQRGQFAEWANALARRWGLREFLVRGRAKVRAILLWTAVAHNMMRARALGVLAKAA